MKHIELFKNGFDSTIDEKIKPENWPYVGYSPIDGFAFSITPNEDGTMYTIYRVVNKDISNSRQSNIELYRILVMLLIVAHHYVVNSGLLAVDGPIYSNPMSEKSLFLLLFGAFGKTGINC